MEIEVNQHGRADDAAIDLWSSMFDDSWKSGLMASANHALELDRLDVVHAGASTFPLTEKIRALSLHRLLDDLPPL